MFFVVSMEFSITIYNWVGLVMDLSGLSMISRLAL